MKHTHVSAFWLVTDVYLYRVLSPEMISSINTISTPLRKNALALQTLWHPLPPKVDPQPCMYWLSQNGCPCICSHPPTVPQIINWEIYQVYIGIQNNLKSVQALFDMLAVTVLLIDSSLQAFVLQGVWMRLWTCSWEGLDLNTTTQAHFIFQRFHAAANGSCHYCVSYISSPSLTYANSSPICKSSGTQ